MKPCDSCRVGKAKQKDIPKLQLGEPSKNGESRIYLDVATVKHRKGQPKTTKPIWQIMVDKKTQLKFSDFYKTKDGMIEPTCEQLFKWQKTNKTVMYIRLDNAGENKRLQKRCESADWKLTITFEEYTARDTPQQNTLAE